MTPAAGLVLVAEADRVLGVVDAIDAEVGSLKARRRGLSAGELVLAAAESMLAGGDFMVDLDHRRADRAGAALRAVPEPPASTTFIACGRRFDDAALAGVEAAMGLLVRRWTAVWRSAARIPDDAWRPAQGMAGAEVAACDYVPGGWPPGTRTVVRRVRLDANEVRSDPRSRRRRTIEPCQLTMALGGGVDHVYAYSFIVTSLAGDPTEIEAWFRQRAHMEERIKDSKLGFALRHLPSGYAAVNAVWMWAAFLALNLSVFIQSLGGVDDDGRAHGKRLRRELLLIPARVLRHARRIILRLAPGTRHGPFTQAWTALQALPTA